MEDVKDYIVNNLEVIQLLLLPITIKKNNAIKDNDSYFHFDIIKQYNNIVKWTIAEKIVDGMDITIEDAIIAVESIDISSIMNNEETSNVEDVNG